MATSVLDRDDGFDEKTILEQLAKDTQKGVVIPRLSQALSTFVSNPDSVSIFTYQRMVETDETVGAAVDLLALSVVGRLGEYAHPSQEIAEFVKAAFAAMRGSMRSLAAEIMSAKWAGFSVSEICYALGTMGGRPIVAWDAVKTLPPATIAFEVDDRGEITDDGIVQFERPLRRSSGWMLQNVRVPDQLAGLGNAPWPQRFGELFGEFNRIPRRKVIHYASGTPNFGNPYGRSPLRRAYKSWLMKDVILRMLLTALDRKGTPLIVGRAPESQVVIYGPNGEPVLDSNGDPKTASAQVLMSRALSNLHQDSAIVIGGDKEETSIDKVEFGQAGSEFIEALQYLNRAIIHSMLLPSLIMGEGQRSGSLALGKAHLDTFKTVIDHELESLTDILIEQLIRPLIVLNFGELAEGYGSFSPVALDPDEKQILAEVFETLIDKGVMDPADLHDWQHIRNQLDIPADEEIFDRQEPDDDDLDDVDPDPADPPKPKDDDRSRMKATALRLLPALRQAA